MTLPSAAALTDALRQYRLLESSQLDQVAAWPARSDPKTLAKELVQRGWLTPYQVNQLLQGRGQDLVLGSYIILERIGEGGMGQVFKARNWKLGKVVALKVIRKDRFTNVQAVRRFQREIQAAARLSHPNIVRAVDADQVGDIHFFVMDYIEGIDLTKLVKQRGPLPIDEACACVYQSALGLQHAHEHGLIHRDIKPSNLLLATRPGLPKPGAIKVLDLGLARMLNQADDDGSGTLTETGVIVGTPDYNAPEQARQSHQVDIRADLYSLGCVLYFLLTGQAPFPGGTVGEKLVKHQLDEPEPVEKLRPDVPPGVVALIRKLMAKKPEDRFQTPKELVAVLANGVPQPEKVSGPFFPKLMARCYGAKGKKGPDTFSGQLLGRRPWLVLGGLGGLSLLGMCLLFSLVLSFLPRTTGTAALSGDPDTVLKRLTEQVHRLPANPEPLRQDLLAFQRAHAGKPQALEAARLLMRLPSALDQFEAKAIPADAVVPGQPKDVVAVLGEQRGRNWGGSRCAVFIDDRWVASGGDDGAIRFWDATLQERAVLRGHPGSVNALALTADRKLLASGGAEGTVRLWNVGADGGSEREVLNPRSSVLSLAFMPKGEGLAAGCMDGTIWLWNVEGRPAKEAAVLRGIPGPVNALTLHPDGKALIAGCGDNTVRVWKLGEGGPQEIGVFKEHTMAVTSVACAPNGRVMVSGSLDGTVRIWKLNTDNPGKESRAFKTGNTVGSVAFTADNKTLIAGLGDGSVRLWHLGEGEPKSGAVLAGHRSVVYGLAFSPGGHTLASASLDGSVRLWNLDSTPPRERVAVRLGAGVTRTLAFSPDGQRLAAGHYFGIVHLWNLTGPPGRAPFLIREATSMVNSVAFAPDGQTLATGTGSGTVHLWNLASAEPSEWSLLQEPGKPQVTAVRFAPDGRTLAAASVDAAIHWWDLTGSRPKERTPLAVPKSGTISLAFAPDSRTLAWSGNTRDGLVGLWDVGSTAPRERPVLKGHTNFVNALAFSPDGKLLATGSHDSTIRLWNLTGADPKPDTELKGHNSQTVWAVAFAPDGRMLASASQNGHVIWWETASGKRFHEWRLPGPVYGLAYAPDGRHLATANANGTVYIIRLPPP